MLAERHRPQPFDDVVGQDKAIRLLKWHLDRTETGLAILLTGPSGSGKTTLAECAGRYWGVADFDVHRIESAECDVATLRKLANDMSYFGSGKSGRKLYIIDEIHTVTGRAADRLLSLLESLPAHVLLVGTTTQADWTDGILLSRWVRFDLGKPRAADVAAHLERVAEIEGLPTPDNGWALRYVKGNGINIRELLNQLPARLLGSVEPAVA